jgi:hypothetical protein
MPEVNKANLQIVFWSADTIHGTESENTGKDDACVFYIPSVPLTPSNAVRYFSQFWVLLMALTPCSNTLRNNVMLS